ncbi:MAG: putative lipid II flippase FtsW [Myxococcales bacterium]|jgi:cell division protein FtsW|nr:putative lipid II flippase FtsW [Myxococcales bacterium]
MATDVTVVARAGTATSPRLKPLNAQFDQVLLYAVLALCALGLVMLYSASSVVAATSPRYANSAYFLERQIAATVIGLFGLVAMLKVRYLTLRRWAYPILVVILVLLVAVLFSDPRGGARRWLNLPVFALQPGELAKLSVAIYLAHSLAKKRDKVKSFSVGFLPHCCVTGLIALLILVQPDFGSAVALAVILFSMLFAAGTRLSYLLGSVLAVLPIAIWQVTSRTYRMDRIRAFLDPWTYRKEEGYQITESLLAIGSGGVSGLGLGEGRHKLFYLPEAHTDFIFSIIGEELGLIGTIAVISLFAIIVWRGLRIALNAADAFGAYLALGLTVLLAFQSIGNMAVTMSLMPTKGMTLPFISYGGSSLVVNLLAVGILLSISESRGGFLRPQQGSVR